jgi:lysyl-tRNA synthetase class 2
MQHLKKPSTWWEPGRHTDRRPFLRARSAIVKALRHWFENEGFVEIETSILQVSPGNETHLHALATTWTTPGGQDNRSYLRTSPEFAAKKLLTAGESRIVEFAKVFRNRERGDLHLPEFTMLEWYRAGADFETAMADCVALLVLAAKAAGTSSFSFRGARADPTAEPEVLSMQDAFMTRTGIDLLSTVKDGEGDRAALAAAAATHVRVTSDDDWSDIFSKILVAHIEPTLGQSRLTVLKDYPVPEAALARKSPDDPRVAERFEIYACGVELANGYGELTDAGEQRMRFERAMTEKFRRYGERYPIDEDFLSAVARMPSACGVALGLDRLVMLASGATRIDQVVWTPSLDGI